MNQKYEIKDLFLSYIKENDLDIALSYSMPSGYEEAFGTFDIICKTLFFNENMLKNKPLYEVLYYFYHELRHAGQYLHPQLFDELIRKSIQYVVLYDGTCFKLEQGKWLSCRLCGSQEYFTLVYENLPYEIDANTYACDIVKALLPEETKEIESLYRSWLPEKSVSQNELETIYRQIDQATFPN